MENLLFLGVPILKHIRVLGVPILKHIRVFFKVNGYTFRGSNSAILIFASLLSWGFLLREQILFFMSKPHFDWLCHQRLIKVVHQLKFSNMFCLWLYKLYFHYETTMTYGNKIH